MTGTHRAYATPALVGALTLLLGCPGSSAAADAPDVQKCQLHLLGDTEMKLQGRTLRVTAETRISYTLSRTGPRVAATLDGIDLTARQDGREVMHAVTNKDRMFMRQQGQVVKDVTRDKASPEDRQKMDETFGKPAVTYTIDEDGRELRRTLSAAPGARAFIDRGTASNLRLFHPPFFAGKDRWQAPCEVSTGKDTFVRGELTYEKVKPAGGAGQVQVKVSGRLTNQEGKPGPAPAGGVVYKVKGEQTYDPGRKQWVAGKLVMDVSITLQADGKPIGSGTGEITATFSAVPGK